jgi:hypothetical protein
MKKLLLLFLIWFAALTVQAQPSLCTISGTIYKPSGAVCGGCTLKITKSRKGSTILSTAPVTITANGSGVVSFTAVQGSFTTIQGEFLVGSYAYSSGVELYIPTSSTANLEDLQTANDILSGGLNTLIVRNAAGTALSGRYGDLQFTGAGVSSVTGSNGAAVITISGGGGGGAVDSVFGRTGDVVAATNDYTWAQINKSTSSLADITTRSASDLSSGTLPDGRFPATLPAVSGANLTNLNASNISSGTINAARLPDLSGTYQPLDSDLTAIAALTTTSFGRGLLTETDAASLNTTLGLAAIAASGSADDLSAGTVPLARLAGITNTEISNSAGIAYSKLNLTGAILNADLAGSIANDKLANSSITIAGTSTSLGASISLDTITGLSTTGVVKRTGANTLAIGSVDLTSEVTGDLPFANFVQAGSAGFVGATGAGDYAHRTPTQVTAALDAFVGDSGSGGTKGLVPAPSTGDATKFLKGDGTWATVSAGGSPGGSGSEIQYRSDATTFGAVTNSSVSGANVTLAGTVTDSQSLSANTSGDGLILTNPATASSGNQMYSPRIRLTGQGWKTTATAASQAVDWIVENQPVQGAANPTSNLVFSSQINGGGYTQRLALTSAGALTVTSITSTINPLTISGNGSISLQPRLAATFVVDSGTDGVSLNPSVNVLNVRSGRLNINAPTGSSTDLAQLYALSASASRVGLRVDTASTPSVEIADFTNNGASRVKIQNDSSMLFSGIAFADLGTPTNGTLAYCTDCTVTSGADNTCAGSGSGALAVRLNGVWRCFNAQN